MKWIVWIWVLLLGVSSASAETVYASRTTQVFASPGEATLGRIYAGTRLDADSEQNGFRQVRFAGLNGYVEADAVSGAQGQIDIHMAKVVSPYGTETVVLRSSPSNSYKTVSIIQAGASVQTLGVFNGFVLVRIGDVSGFLSKNEIE